MSSQYIDLAFPVRGSKVPSDHAYALYAALSRAIAGVHGANWIAVLGIAGTHSAADELVLEPRGVLRIRVPSDKLSVLLALVGMTLDVGGRPVTVGAPTVHALVPAAILDARLVVIRLTGGMPKPFDRAVFEQRFVAEAKRQLAALGVNGELELCGRRNLRVGGQRVVGHAVRVWGLSPEDSLKLQSGGLGGKRTMGCGIFRPARLKQQARQVA